MLRVLLCKHGHGAFTSGAAPGHAHQTHDVLSLTDSEAEEFAGYCERNHIRSDLGPESPSPILLAPRGPPVQLVDLHEGFACGVDSDRATGSCTFCCRSKDHMENHIRRMHKDMSNNQPASNCHYPATVQSLSQHFSRVFFQVLPELAGVPLHDPLDRVLRDYIPNLPRPSVAPPDTERERTPFMRFMNWDRHLSHVRTDQSKLGLVLSLQQRPAPGPEESHLSRLTTAVQSYIRLGTRICRNENQSFTIRKILIHGENIPSGGR